MGEDALRAARERAAGIDPREAAARAAATFVPARGGAGTFEFAFVGSKAVVTWPQLQPALEDGPPLPPHIAALLVHYLGKASDLRPSGRWISFAELPDGSVYVQAFHGYTADALVRRFGADPEPLAEAAVRLCGQPLPGLADRAWRFEALPKVPVALLWWDADDEFPARADLLFDSTASHHLPTDGCAVLGSWLTQALIRSSGERGDTGASSGG
jgi:hypothetical protein